MVFPPRLLAMKSGGAGAFWPRTRVGHRRQLALPLIEIAGRDAYDEIMTPLPLAVAERCHARPRVGRFCVGAPAGWRVFAPAASRIIVDVAEVPANRGRQHGR